MKIVPWQRPTKVLLQAKISAPAPDAPYESNLIVPPERFE